VVLDAVGSSPIARPKMPRKSVVISGFGDAETP